MGIFGASILPTAAIRGVLADPEHPAISAVRGPQGAGPMSGDYPYAVPQSPAYKQPSTGRMILGGIGDALQQWSGGQPTFGPEMQRQRQYAMQLQMAQQQRAQEFADQTRLYDYKAAHPAAPTQTALQNNYDWLKANHPETAEQYLQAQTTAPPIVQRNGDGTSTIYPAGSIPRTASSASGAQIPDTAVSYLRANPATAAQFDQKYGAGASQQYLTGASVQQGGSILSGGAQTGVISPAQAAQIRASLGPNGQAAFEQWMAQNHITIGGN